MRWPSPSLPRIFLPPQHLRQTGQTTTILHKLMPQELLGARPTLDVDTQADAQESLEFSGELAGVLQPRRAIGGNQEESFERLFVEIGRLRLDHLDRHDAERPYVDFRSVLLLFHHLGGHPIWRADHRGALVLRFRQFGAKAKVSCKATLPTG